MRSLGVKHKRHAPTHNHRDSISCFTWAWPSLYLRLQQAHTQEHALGIDLYITIPHNLKQQPYLAST